VPCRIRAANAHLGHDRISVAGVAIIDSDRYETAAVVPDGQWQQPTDPWWQRLVVRDPARVAPGQLVEFVGGAQLPAGTRRIACAALI
jgi:hypothetical protein